MTRERHTFGSHGQVAHIWAQQEVSHGRAGNIYFEGARIYSYGSHYLAGHIVKDASGRKVALLNDRKYSVSTSQHMAHIRSALEGLMPYWFVSHPSAYDKVDHRANLKALDTDIDTAVQELLKARAYHEYRRQGIHRAVQEREEYRAAFKLGGKYKEVDWHALSLAEDKQREFSSKREAKAEAEEYSRRRDRIMVVLQQALDLGIDTTAPGAIEVYVMAWRRGEAQRDNLNIPLLQWAVDNQGNPTPPHESSPWGIGERAKTMLRRQGDECVTSLGAHVPLDHAQRIYRLWSRLQGRMPPEGWVNPGDSQEGKVGHFKVDRIDADGTLKAGCHTIQADEIRAFGEAMGWAE